MNGVEYVIFSGERRLTNEAYLWYVPVNVEDAVRVLPVPPLKTSSEQAEIGKLQYKKSKRTRSCAVLDKYTHGERPVNGRNDFIGRTTIFFLFRS